MEHVVFYPGADGVPSFERVNSLDEAVQYVERLRNVEAITEFSVHALTAVPLSLRAYYHVEVPATDESAPTTEDAAAEPFAVEADELPMDSAEVPSVEVAAPVDVLVGAEEPAVAVAPELPEPPSMPELVEAPEVSVAADEAPAVDVDGGEVTMAPIEADDDRSAEWVAEASVVEAPVAVAPEVEVPEVEVPEVAPAAEVVEPVPFVPPIQMTPFADAPPVSAPVVAVATEPVAVAEDEPAAEVVPIPSGRRSMGFFAR